MAHHTFLVQPTSSIPVDLINQAVAEISPKASTAHEAEPKSNLTWPTSCQQILEVYVKMHYRKMSVDSPEYKIIKPLDVTRTGGRVFKLVGGQIYNLPGGSSSAYVAIPLKSTGFPIVEVVGSKQSDVKVPWDEGSLVYLTGNTKLKCSGSGEALGILLAMSYKNE